MIYIIISEGENSQNQHASVNMQNVSIQPLQACCVISSFTCHSDTNISGLCLRSCAENMTQRAASRSRSQLKVTSLSVKFYVRSKSFLP